MSDLDKIIEQIREFADQRDWHQFHSPKNVSMALAVEAAELMEHFQWLTQAQSKALSAEKKHAVSEEIADVFLYLLRLCDELGVDLIESANQKIIKNAAKYPVEKAKGRALKYHEL